ncbi:DUF192 domain-containing protein [Halomonas mongoliensis]|uniref:DUF192 domain-containing protein n=1 Tax=Halomonas mongoliensis TaxID=321265 RepID=UPI00403AB286
MRGVGQGLGAAALLLALPAGLVAEPPEPGGAQRLPLLIHAAEGPRQLGVEVARTIPERRRGLMERDHLDEDAGMLFLYRDTQSALSGFWMYRTLIPLDIAFIGEDERIAAIFTMWPCGSANPSECPVTYPGVPYRAALEVNAGAFEAWGIAEGDCVSWPGSVGHCLPSAAEEGMGPAE